MPRRSVGSARTPILARSISGLMWGFEGAIHRLLIVQGPVSARIRKWLVDRPELHDDIKRLALHETIDPVFAIDVEHLPIPRQAARRDRKVEPHARGMIEDRDAVADLEARGVGPKSLQCRAHDALAFSPQPSRLQ